MCKRMGIVGRCVIVKYKEFKSSMTAAVRLLNRRMVTVSGDRRVVRGVISGIARTTVMSIASRRTLESVKLKGFSMTVVTVKTSVETSVVTALVTGRVKMSRVMYGTGSRLRTGILCGVKTSEMMFPRESVKIEITRGLISSGVLSRVRLSPRCSVMRVIAPAD